MRRTLCIAVLLTLAAGGAQAQQTPAASASTSTRYDDVSAYRRFLIYPHQQRAHEAMQRGDAARAMSEFEQARGLAPRSVGTALDLATAYQRFGEAQRARGVLVEQLLATPADPRLLAALQALDLATAKVDCARHDSPVCRAQRGFEALRSGELQRAEHELEDETFANAPEGLSLRRSLAQRAIHVGDMPLAARQFEALERQGALSRAEGEQWFNVLLVLDRPQRAQALQERGGLDAAAQRLALAQLLARRGDWNVLAGYLRSSPPRFEDETQEKAWIYLLQRVVRLQPSLLREYRPRTPAGRRLHAGLVLPQAMHDAQWPLAESLLQRLPQNGFREQRFEVALQRARHDEALMHARATRDAPGGAASLDVSSYRLLEAGAEAQAATLLMESYPFAGTADPDPLFARLAVLAASHPEAFGVSERVRLRTPLQDAQRHAGQLRVWVALHDCEGLRAAMGGLDGEAPAMAWRALADCYRATQPGLAQHAYAQAHRLQGDADSARALAYQAFAAQDMATAMSVWRALPPEQLRDEDLLAAATTALEAGHREEARTWLQAYAAREGAVDAVNDRYWWLVARAEPETSSVAVDALRKAIAIRPDAAYYVALADVQERRGEDEAALRALLQAQAMTPQDAVLARRIGYAHLQRGAVGPAIEQFERARASMPGDDTLIRQLMYLNQARGDRMAARHYAALAIDRFDAEQSDAQDIAQSQQRFALRRLHEDLGRRWSVDADLILGDTTSSAANPIAPGVSYRSYFQAEAQYRLDDAWRNERAGGLSAYARVFAGSGRSGDVWPTHAPMLGVGLHWKPWRAHNAVLSLEQQAPLDNHPDTRGDTMARFSYSTAFRDRYNQDWRPATRWWATQNLYLDLAHYLRSSQTAVTADYRVSLHRRLAAGQTLEPYAHAQFNGLDRAHGAGFGRDVRVGVGVRWNVWYGESRYDAYRHRFSIGVEVQHAFTSYLPERNAVYLTVGKHW
ncbi:NfrA family protein [Oleiagrimonas soli]|uniref:Adsorption protein A n=1 Tax=Oleiagrimonas soli TaxID=1543381 RepID=A0A841KFI7_9GAMM|nr:tetratricopeptide repeat protein [Oleiagrimonas soli]MBB6183962.1 adsorption protein A [Oleiagrimonas soli]